MRALAIAVLIFVIASCFCAYFGIYTNDAVTGLNSQIEAIRQHMNSGEEKKAAEGFFDLKNSWEKYEKIFQILTEHSELDAINEQLAVLSSVFENGDYSHFSESIYTLSFYLDHIGKKNKINLITIL